MLHLLLTCKENATFEGRHTYGARHLWLKPAGRGFRSLLAQPEGLFRQPPLARQAVQGPQRPLRTRFRSRFDTLSN